MRNLVRCLAAALGLALFVDRAETAEPRPNVVVILADDFGYGSLACYGGTGLKTPNVDRLAREGRRFTQAYAPGSVCSPTRYALLTGRYYWRTSVKDGEVLAGNAPLHIETDRLTLASLCKDAGYRTAAIGKWHLGLQAGPGKTDWDRPLAPGPLEIGFDHFFGMASNPWSGPHSLIEDHEIVGKLPGESVVVSGNRENSISSGLKETWREERIMESLTQRSVEWIETDDDRPFLLYFAPNAVHRPITPNPRFTGSPYGPYGDFIHELDWSVGQILHALDRLGKSEDTLVIFTSDNGGVAVEGLTDEIGTAHRAGLKVNGALRGGKHDIWEGGFRVPFLVRWPEKVPAGAVSDDVVCLTDVVATVAGILDAPLPAGAAEDSFDARKAFFDEGNDPAPRDAVILQDADATYAIREGDWKLVERTTTPAVAPRNRNVANRRARRAAAAAGDELFDLANDPGETNNVSAVNADVVERLRRRLIESREQGFTRPGAGREGARRTDRGTN